jgi:hypothetical protein
MLVACSSAMLIPFSLALGIEVVLAPLQVFAILQQLHLIPAARLLPHPRTFIPFSSSSPLQPIPFPRVWTLDTTLSYANAVIFSPYVTLFVWRNLKAFVAHHTHGIVQGKLPKPDDPDVDSIWGAIESEAEASAPEEDREAFLRSVQMAGNLLPPHSTTLNLELHSVEHDDHRLDVELTRNFERAAPHDGLAPNAAREAEDVIERTAAGSDQSTPSPVPGDMTPNEPDSDGLFTLPEELHNIDRHNILSQDSDVNPLPIESIESNQVGEEDMLLVFSDDEDENRRHRPRPHLARTNSNGTEFETLTMEVEIAPPRPPNAPGGGTDPFPRHTVTAGHWENSRRKNPGYRVTSLSSHFAEVIAERIAEHFMAFITIPIETYLVRRLAAGFIAATTNDTMRENAAFFSTQIFTPGIGLGIGSAFSKFGTGALLSHGSLTRLGRYVVNIMTCMGIELAMSIIVFQLGYAGAMWMGKKWYRWGNLRES